MGYEQIVKTQKRIVFSANGTNTAIGATTSAFLDVDGLTNTYGIPKGLQYVRESGITNGSPSISRIVSGSTAFNIQMSGHIVFTGQAAGEYNFERMTLKHPSSVNPNGTIGIVAGAGTVIVEVVL
jgi:hypothetical protein